MTTSNHDNQLLRAMLQYYDQRAPEYDQWYLRLGRYDTPDLNDQWFQDLCHLARLVAEFAASYADQPVLELACGTGFWSALAARSCRLIATDPAPGMLGQTRSRLHAARASAGLVRADAYRLPFAPQSFAAAFAGFFISHVPPACLDPLFADLARVVRRGADLVSGDVGLFVGGERLAFQPFARRVQRAVYGRPR
jgi:demethylmenaquinone methyltransferase/2-methoxy-6-polyprenyl-1,4-benzoquinol methylase